METSNTKVGTNVIHYPKDSSAWWRSALRFDEHTKFIIGLDEKSIIAEKKEFLLPCIILGRHYVEDLMFLEDKITLIAGFTILDDNILEPVPFQKSKLAYKIEIPYNSIYIVQKKVGIVGKEITIYKS